MSTLADTIVPMVSRLSPLKEYALNHLVNRVPFVGLRMSLYELFGVKLAMRGTGMIMLHTEIVAPSALEIGRNSVIGANCVLDARGGVTIGESVNMGSRATVQTATHVVDSPDFQDAYAPVTIGDRAWIAEGASIQAGVTVGEGAVVAAGAVATSDVAPYTLVAGVPARYVRDRARNLSYHLGFRGNFM